MTTIEREELLSDLDFKELFHAVGAKHQVPEYVIKILLKNRQIKDYCVSERIFAILKNSSPMYISYEVSNWIKNNHILTNIDRINFYDDQLEYDLDRMKGLHSTNHNSFPERN